MRSSTTFLCIASIATTTFCGAAFSQTADFVLLSSEDADASFTLLDDHRFVHPVTSPYFHEDSFITSDVRVWHLYHDFPKSSLIAGGKAHVTAAQVRIALTDCLQLVAYKDGYANIETGLVDDSGLMDIAAGLKWAFHQDWGNQFHMAAGVGYELSVGDDEVLQDDSEWRFWMSVNKGWGKAHLGATVNLFLGEDKDEALGNSDRLSWHVHFDYRVNEWFSPVIELNGYHTLDEGTAPLPFSGVDVANLGGGDGEDVITYGIGAEFRPWDENIGLRLAYEAPITSDDDLFGYRWTFSLRYSF